ncbi:hypothetical protein D3C73_1656720 [compost metagenome]
MQRGAAQAQLVAVGRELHGRAAQRLVARGIGGCGKLDVHMFGLHRRTGQVGKLGEPAGE